MACEPYPPMRGSTVDVGSHCHLSVSTSPMKGPRVVWGWRSNQGTSTRSEVLSDRRRDSESTSSSWRDEDQRRESAGRRGSSERGSESEGVVSIIVSVPPSMVSSRRGGQNSSSTPSKAFVSVDPHRDRSSSSGDLQPCTKTRVSPSPPEEVMSECPPKGWGRYGGRR